MPSNSYLESIYLGPILERLSSAAIKSRVGVGLDAFVENSLPYFGTDSCNQIQNRKEYSTGKLKCQCITQIVRLRISR